MANLTVRLVKTHIMGWAATRAEDDGTVVMYPVLLDTEDGTYNDTGIKIHNMLTMIPAPAGQMQVKLVLYADGKPAKLGTLCREDEIVEFPLGIQMPGDTARWEQYRREAESELSGPYSCFSWYFDLRESQGVD